MCGCSKTIKKLTNITEGQISALAEKLFSVEIMKCKDYDRRFNICSGCNKRTYLTKSEYAEWLIQNGKDIADNFTELEKLPPLPKKEQADNAGMYCRICKCYLDAKCRVQLEHCPLGRW